MKKLTLFILALTIVAVSSTSAQIRVGGRKINTDRVVAAGADLATAITLSDADVARLCKEAVDWMDENNPIADESTEWGARLARLTDGITQANGIPLNFKVYHVVDINAFACGDGSIRVFSSLMDIMDDDELMAIIGHEIGHIVNTDVKDAIKNAYLTSAGRNAAGAAGGTVADLTDSQLGDIAVAFSGAQFSQKQEHAADDYGYKFAIDHGYSPYAMASSLERLVELSNGEKASTVAQMFSSHPDSEKRAVRMREKADKYVSQQ